MNITSYNKLNHMLKSGDYIIVVKNATYPKGRIVDDIRLDRLHEYTLVHRKHILSLHHYIDGGFINGYLNQDFLENYNEGLSCDIIPSYNGRYIRVTDETRDEVISTLNSLNYKAKTNPREGTDIVLIEDGRLYFNELHPNMWFRHFKEMWLSEGTFIFEKESTEKCM